LQREFFSIEVERLRPGRRGDHHHRPPPSSFHRSPVPRRPRGVEDLQREFSSMRMCADVIEPIAMVIITIDPTPIVFSEMERSVAAGGQLGFNRSQFLLTGFTAPCGAGTSIPGSRPSMRSAAIRPEPQASVQPRCPWPELTQSPSKRVRPMIGVPAGLTGLKPAQIRALERSRCRLISGKVELALSMTAWARAMAGSVS
jgi:hypothetical protein